MNRTDLIPATILTSCVLHNICICHNDFRIEKYVTEGINNNNKEEDPMNQVHRAVPNENIGYQKRNELAELLYYRI